jgi:hypothetical protein
VQPPQAYYSFKNLKLTLVFFVIGGLRSAYTREIRGTSVPSWEYVIFNLLFLGATLGIAYYMVLRSFYKVRDSWGSIQSERKYRKNVARVTAIKAEIGALEDNLRIYLKKKMQIITFHQKMMAKIVSYYHVSFAAYRAANIRTRTTAPPKSFHGDPPPLSFQSRDITTN